MPLNPEPTEDQRLASLGQALSGFFDAAWYAATYPDVIAAGFEPLRHFIVHGALEGRNPNRWFDSAWYLEHYPDVARSGTNPLVHYLQIGARDLRNPHPRFDAAWYVAQHPSAANNPLLYHLRFGVAQGWPTEKPVTLDDCMPSATPLPRAPAQVAVDVVIPVYRGLAETRQCIETVLADPSRPPGRIIVIDDQSPERALSDWLDKLAGKRRIELLRNRRNMGFVASANRGMAAAGTHDVVLLNSDTEVPPGWLARLAGHAHAEPRIASVSPFSNNATICGYPGNAGGPMPFDMKVAELDAVCQAANAGRRVEVPTTVGFCMYIKRAALLDAGAFDEAAFGRGYGEENDFCRRTAARGWRHVLACDTFVYHAGGVSFADETDALSRRAMALLLKRYPDYQELVSRHVAADHVGPFRFAVTAEIFRRAQTPNILLVCHALGGGVQRHLMTLVKSLAGRANFLLLTATDRGATVSVPALPDHPSLTLPPERLDDLAALLRHCRVSRVHIHHLMSMDLDIRALIHRLGVPFDVTVHDYFAICPQVNLLSWPDEPYCGEPGPAGCNACIGERQSHGAREILSWRLENAWQFMEADRVFCPSADVRDRLSRYGLDAHAVVVPHEPVAAGPWKLSVPTPRGRKLRIAVLGVLANHKGAQAVASLAEGADPATMEVHLIGDVEEDFPQPAKPLLRITGKYQEGELPALLARIKPHVLWFPSPGPETYSFTLTAAIDSGLPVVATRIGSFPERLAGRPFTWLAEPNLSTSGWLQVFAEVHEAIRGADRPNPAPERQPVADYYARHYLRPAAPSIANRLVNLRREGRTRVVIVPERFSNGSLSPCAFIRLLQPLDHMARAVGLNLVLADAVSALDYQADVIVTQRHAIPSLPAADALARHAAATGATLVYDMDDDLLAIPRDHPDAAELRPKARIVQRMLHHADQVWVSTPALAARLAPLRGDALVLPNALDERLWVEPASRSENQRGPVRILYMGTATHDADLALIMPALERIKTEFAHRVSIELLGVTRAANLPPWIVRPTMSPNALASYPGFVNWITTQPGWDIGLAPLVDSDFTRCKSAIKTLDCAALRMAVLASDVGVYRGSLADGPGGMLVGETPDDWYAALSWLIRNPEPRRTMASAARRAFLASGTLAVHQDARLAAWDRMRKAPNPTALRAISGAAAD